MEKTTINFDDFSLPFISPTNEINENKNTAESDSDYEEDDVELDEEEELNADEMKEKMESLIPKNAIFIGAIDSEVENWTSWSIQDDYYILPMNEGVFDWALFRVTWDDNWGSWDWSFDARLKGFKNNYKGAAKYILVQLWERWEIDLNDKSNSSYLRLLNKYSE